MKFSRSIAWGSCMVATIVLASAVMLASVASPAFGQARPAGPRPASTSSTSAGSAGSAGSAVSTTSAGPLVDSAHPLMQVEEVALKGNTNVFGDPSKPGMYVVRMRLTTNQVARPHYDDQDRLVTVLQGTLWLGKGNVFRPDKLVQLRQGGMAYLPANTHYYEMAGDGEVILQITGSGPVRSVHSEIDEKGRPVPEGGPYPVLAAGRRRNMPIDPDLIDPDTQDALDRAAAAKKAAAQGQAKPPTTTTPAAATAAEPKK